MKPAVILSIPLVWGVRNFIRSGLAENLGQDFHVIFAIPVEGKESLLLEGVPETDIWILEKPSRSRAFAWLMRILKSAHSRRYPTKSDPIFNAWLHRSITLKQKLRNIFFDILGYAAANQFIFALLDRKAQEVFRRNIQPKVFNLLQETKPILGLSTSYVVDWEWTLFQAMKMLNIPIATHILSFDNLTSRGYIPLKHFDRYFVWQTRMADELKRLYQIEEHRIVITGTPQFDFHTQEKFHWSREKTCQVIGLRYPKPYLVYCANHIAISPNEPQLLNQILTELGKDDKFADYQWVLRLHPMDQYERWAELTGRFEQLVISHPWAHNDKTSFWAVPTGDDLALLGNTLRYAKATLTVASTVALDSAIVDTPIICIGFHPNVGSHEDRFYHDAHFSHHYFPIMQTQAVPLAGNIESLKKLLADVIENPDTLKEERDRLVIELCGVVDGQSGNRIITAITNTIHHNGVNAGDLKHVRSEN